MGAEEESNKSGHSEAFSHAQASEPVLLALPKPQLSLKPFRPIFVKLSDTETLLRCGWKCEQTDWRSSAVHTVCERAY